MASGAASALTYDRILRTGRPGAWRPIVGVIAFAVLLFVGIQLVGIAVALTAAATGAEVGTSPVTPLGLALVNLIWAVAIPIAWLVVRVVHGLTPGWLSSVVRGLRWRWLLTCVGLALLALVATLMVSLLVPARGGAEVGGGLNEFTATTRNFALVVLLLTPLQAAGEEYAFRGYLTQAVGSATGRTWLAVVVPAVLFALAHGAQDPPVFVDRLAFGLVAGLLVVLTGGLEAAIAMHVLNNFLAFGLALAFGDMGSALTPTGGTWWSLPVTLTQSLVYLVVVVAVARRAGLATSLRGGPGEGGAELERRRARV